MDEQQPASSEVQKELQYLKKKLTELSGESIKYDYQLSSMRFELKQRKDAFSTLTSLQKKFSISTPLPELFRETVKAVIIQLQMDRAILLLYDPGKQVFTPSQWYGYLPEHAKTIIHDLKLPEEYLEEGEYLLVNKSVAPTELINRVREDFLVNYFVGVPILYDNNPVAYLIASRLFEKVPFNQPLNKGDGDTLLAIASLVAAVLQNKNVAELKVEMQKQKEENELVNRMLAELKTTQAQLIQSEKMASLGELTAGIAHEIQNPLNFVNNFSEINIELVNELKTSLDSDEIEEAKELMDSILNNLEKINHHGRRADSIVKNMLQHSRVSNGKKEDINLNELVDEYLRLAYHGFRAKDKSFNSKLQTTLDPQIKTVTVVPQDISRVMINLLNNSFYAVNKKNKQIGENGEYEPMVNITTELKGNKVRITVSDNGNGIPASAVDKIFQPFFTTKPTAEGTGLGLSLSYDIITKGHGGELLVKTKEGEGTSFTIVLNL